MEDARAVARIWPSPGLGHGRGDQCAGGDQEREEHAGGTRQLAPRRASASPFLDRYGDDEHGAGEHAQRERHGGAAVARPQRGKRRRVDLRVEQGTAIRVWDEKAIELRGLARPLVRAAQRHRDEAGGQRDGAGSSGAAALGDAEHALGGNRAGTSGWRRIVQQGLGVDEPRADWTRCHEESGRTTQAFAGNVGGPATPREGYPGRAVDRDGGASDRGNPERAPRDVEQRAYGLGRRLRGCEHRRRHRRPARGVPEFGGDRIDPAPHLGRDPGHRIAVRAAKARKLDGASGYQRESGRKEPCDRAHEHATHRRGSNRFHRMARPAAGLRRRHISLRPLSLVRHSNSSIQARRAPGKRAWRPRPPETAPKAVL